MLTTAALQDADVLLVGPLLTHRRGPVRGRPYLALSIWCHECRHEHSFPFPDDGRPDVALPVSMPCREPCRWSGRRVYVAADPRRHDESRRALDRHALDLRRFLIRERIERELEMERAAFERRYSAGSLRGATPGPAAGHLGATYQDRNVSASPIDPTRFSHFV
jgi:hypothetical protein